jgi:SagB-type dehydrogenase family enzyme
MQLKEAIKKRKSVRKFMSNKSPNWRKIIKAIDAARFAPAAGNEFVTKFILVSDEKKIAEIATASQQPFIKDAKYLVAVVTDDSRLVKLYGDRGTRYAGQQSGAAIQNFLLALTEQGLATTWVGHFDDDYVKRVLGIDKETVEAVFPIGKETKIETQDKPKKELESIIYFDKWKNKKMRLDTRVSVESI